MNHPCTPEWVATMGLAAIAAAVMSSIDSSILSAASLFTWNIYRVWFKKSDEKHLRKVTKLSVLMIGTSATLLALKVKSVYTLWYLCADILYIVLFPQLVMVLFFKKSNSFGAISGFLLGLFLRLGGGEPSLGIPVFISYPFLDQEVGTLFPFRLTAMLSSLTSIYLVSVFSEYLGLNPILGNKIRFAFVEPFFANLNKKESFYEFEDSKSSRA